MIISESFRKDHVTFLFMLVSNAITSNQSEIFSLNTTENIYMTNSKS